MRYLNAEEHRQRQKNLLEADSIINRCLKKFTIQNYLSGQVIYNLGEYPARFSIMPTEYDSELLSEFAKQGVELIQIHEEYNDPLRVLGADKFTSHDEEGLQKFVDLVHSNGIKIIPYISSGYFSKTDPDFCEEWAHHNSFLKQFYYNYAHCSPASPEWRAYFLPRIEHLMDKYGFDGLYNDLGYVEIWNKMNLYPDQISPEPETNDHDAALEDLLGIIMNLVHKRGGISKIHYDRFKVPKCYSKVYDYIWVGECVNNMDVLRENVKDITPFVVPSVDLFFAPLPDEDEFYINSIPYMQFPLRVDGRPMTGERGMVPGIEYADTEKDMFNLHCYFTNDYYKKHPNGPYIYNAWDGCYVRPEARDRWFYYLNLYRPMVTDNSRCWIDIKESKIFMENLPENMVASLFVNEKVYLVLANYGTLPVTIKTFSIWQDRESKTKGSEWLIPSRKLKLLEKIEYGED